MPVRSFRPLAAGLTFIGAALLALAPPLSAQASLGSVPVVVGDYVASGQLQARLAQVYGPGAAKGSGVDFDATTKPGPISRVYEWTDDRYAHADSDHPIQLTNYWTVPITIADKPIGAAAVWINPTSDEPELAEFTKSAALATALAAVPADAALVHDGTTAAWYGVANGTATPLVEGRSGVTKPMPVADLALTREAVSASTARDSNTGIGLAVGVLVLLVLVIVATVLLPRFLRATPTARATEATPVPAEPPVVVEEPTAPDPEPAAPRPRTPAKPRPTTPRTTAPRAPAAQPRTPVTQKPASSKPTGTKPAASRTAATKPPVSKPPVSKPRASKPPTPRARPKKPPQDEAPEA